MQVVSDSERASLRIACSLICWRTLVAECWVSMDGALTIGKVWGGIVGSLVEGRWVEGVMG